MSESVKIRPWYKEPWLWLVILLPASAVVAGIATVIIAVRNADDLVDDNYYQSGLAINRNLDAQKKAQQLDIKGRLFLSQQKIQLQLESSKKDITGDIVLDLLHPTLEKLDKHFIMKNLGHGLYTVDNLTPIKGRRYLRITSQSEQWVIKSELIVETGKVVLISAN